MKLNHTYDHCITCLNKGEVNVNTGEYFCFTCVFQYTFRTDNYKPIPAVRKLKLLAYLDESKELRLFEHGWVTNPGWKRVPSEDKEIEVKE